MTSTFLPSPTAKKDGSSSSDDDELPSEIIEYSIEYIPYRLRTGATLTPDEKFYLQRCYSSSLINPLYRALILSGIGWWGSGLLGVKSPNFRFLSGAILGIFDYSYSHHHFLQDCRIYFLKMKDFPLSQDARKALRIRFPDNPLTKEFDEKFPGFDQNAKGTGLPIDEQMRMKKFLKQNKNKQSYKEYKFSQEIKQSEDKQEEEERAEEAINKESEYPYILSHPTTSIPPMHNSSISKPNNILPSRSMQFETKNSQPLATANTSTNTNTNSKTITSSSSSSSDFSLLDPFSVPVVSESLDERSKRREEWRLKRKEELRKEKERRAEIRRREEKKEENFPSDHGDGDLYKEKQNRRVEINKRVHSISRNEFGDEIYEESN